MLQTQASFAGTSLYPCLDDLNVFGYNVLLQIP